ncbi:MAG: AMP-binding protein, partial [Gemmatimonadaceae bacterium]
MHRTTFAQLDHASRVIAAQLQRDGVRAGANVLFFAPPSRALYAALVATWRIGAVAMFVEPSAGRETLDSACALSPPMALIASPKAHLLRLASPALRAIPRKYSTIGWVPGTSALGRSGDTAPNVAIAVVAPDAAALLTFTSGSTGQPKGAIRTHAILRAQLQALSGDVAAGRGECEMVALPIVVLLNLANGVQTVLPHADLRRPGAIDAFPVLEQIREGRITRITASPAFLERLADSPHASMALGGLRTVVTGGGPVFPDLVDRLRQLAPAATIVSVYGSTEAEPIAHVKQSEVSEADRSAMERGSGLLAGVPDPAVRLRIVKSSPGIPLVVANSAELNAITLGGAAVGEIMVSGAHVVTSYVNGIGEAETKCMVDGIVWHRTGDLGYLDDAGRLWLLGRAGAVAIDDARAPFYPFAVECAARLRLGVHRVAALVHEGRRVLVLEGQGGGTSAPDAARRALAWAELDDVRLVARIPVDRRHNSKVDY